MQHKSQATGLEEITTKGFGLPFKKTSPIFNYIRRLLKDYPNDPVGALKEISLNLKRNERYLADFILGNYYSPTFKEMKESEMAEFLAQIAYEMDMGVDRMDVVLAYIIEDMIIKMREQSITDVIKTILSTDFSDKEKDYLLFSFGMLSRAS